MTRNLSSAPHRPHTGKDFCQHNQRTWEPEVGWGHWKSLDPPFIPLHLTHGPLCLSLPCPRTRSLQLCPAPALCPGLSSPSLSAQGGTARSGPGRHPEGLRVWRIPPTHFFCSSIIDHISSACTRHAHGIFCSNRAARFPRSAPVCRSRGARERERAAAQCPGQCQRCAPHLSLAAAPLPRRPPGTALHCRWMPEWGRAGFDRCHPPSPPPRRCSWPGGSTIYGWSWTPFGLLHPIQWSWRDYFGMREPGTSAERFPNKNVFLP